MLEPYPSPFGGTCSEGTNGFCFLDLRNFRRGLVPSRHVPHLIGWFAMPIFPFSYFRQRFPDEEKCLEHVLALQCGELVPCPKCNDEKHFSRVANRRCLECACGYQAYPTSDTIFEKSTTPLTEWFYAIYLVTATKRRITVRELEKQLGVSHKTACRMHKAIYDLLRLPFRHPD